MIMIHKMKKELMNSIIPSIFSYFILAPKFLFQFIRSNTYRTNKLNYLWDFFVS